MGQRARSGTLLSPPLPFLPDLDFIYNVRSFTFFPVPQEIFILKQLLMLALLLSLAPHGGGGNEDLSMHEDPSFWRPPNPSPVPALANALSPCTSCWCQVVGLGGWGLVFSALCEDGLGTSSPREHPRALWMTTGLWSTPTSHHWKADRVWILAALH